MSAGPFLDAFYEADNGDIHYIKIQPETAAIAFTPGGTNVIPAGPANKGPARVTGSERSYGRKARLIRLSSSAPPVGYKPNSSIAFPVLTKAVYDAIPDRGGEATYLGATWKVTGKTPESGIG